MAIREMDLRSWPVPRLWHLVDASGDAIMTDVLVVGAGVAGALLAARLASSGAKVTLLEAGSTMDRAKGVQAYLKSPMKVPESAYAPLPWSSRPDTANRSAYYVQTGPHLFKSTYERRVGGTTWH